MSESQEAAILKALQAGEALTPLGSLQRFGSMRLGARIFSLKQQGHPIEKEMIAVGNGKKVARYFLRPALALTA